MAQWEYCEIDFDGSVTSIYFYDEAGEYIDNPKEHPRLGIVLARLGHDGWEIISSWWRSDKRVTYILKRPCSKEWTALDREQSQEIYRHKRPKDKLPIRILAD
jgi:hypothetical protein